MQTCRDTRGAWKKGDEDDEEEIDGGAINWNKISTANWQQTGIRPIFLMTATHKRTHRVLIEILVEAAAVALTDGSKMPTMQERTKTERSGNGLLENFHFLAQHQRQREEFAVRPNLGVVVNAKCRRNRREGCAKKARSKG